MSAKKKFLTSKGLIFVFLLLSGPMAFSSITESKIKEVAYSKQWLKLMHYRQGLFGAWKSEVDGEEFFFSPQGKTDPVGELKAAPRIYNIEKMCGKLKQPLHCAFPARYQFIAKEFSLSLPPTKCPQLEDFLAKFHNPQSLSVVFSSAYPNNPASMFGHTFIKINSERNTDLIDHGINFAAYASENENPFKFVWYGVSGGYFGQWSAQPYYVKVHEYNNFESRDLWEYELNLTPEETQKFIFHLWEIETNSYFYYYFFDKNCSYQILAALEAVKPEWNLTSYSIHLIPGESIKNLYSSPGIVKNVKFRPSLYKKLWQQYNALSKSEVASFHSLVENKTSVANISSKGVLDTGTFFFQYLKSDSPEKFEKDYAQLYRQILSRRAELGLQSEEEKSRLPAIAEDTRPDLGHDAYSISLQTGHHNKDILDGKSEFLGLKIKSAYHDLLNKDLGFNSYSHIDFPAITVRYDLRTKRFYLSEATFLATTSLHPFTVLDKKISYKLDTGISSFKDDFCYLCNYVFAEGGIGITLASRDFKSRWYNFINLRAEGSDELFLGYRLGPGLETGLLFNPWQNYKLQFFARAYWLGSKNTFEIHDQYGLKHSFSVSRNLEIRQENYLARSKSSSQEFETLLSINSFFR